MLLSVDVNIHRPRQSRGNEKDKLLSEVEPIPLDLLGLCMSTSNFLPGQFKMLFVAPNIILTDTSLIRTLSSVPSEVNKVTVFTGALGTVEFVMDKDQNFYFMEMNTRLQVCTWSVCNLSTSGILSIVAKRESVHAKLEARTALRYVQCGLHIYIYRERERERERKSPVHITRRARYARQLTVGLFCAI